MTGVEWRWLRDHAAELGIEIRRVASKPFADAAAVIEAIRRHGELIGGPTAANDERDDEPTIADLRARLGMRRAGGDR
jgi:hypothetical protein